MHELPDDILTKHTAEWYAALKEFADYVISLVVEANAEDEEEVEITTDSNTPSAYIQACLEYLDSKGVTTDALWDKFNALVKIGKYYGIAV